MKSNSAARFGMAIAAFFRFGRRKAAVGNVYSLDDHLLKDIGLNHCKIMLALHDVDRKRRNGAGIRRRPQWGVLVPSSVTRIGR